MSAARVVSADELEVMAASDGMVFDL